MANSSRPRNSLGMNHHSTIDSCLKTLRTTVRNVSALEEGLAEEAQLLERLYYKSKNQHRSALFWRHVCEIRRISGRMMTLDKKGKVGRCLETLRSSFHEPQSDGVELSNKAQRRQAWSLLPSNKLLISHMHQLYELSALLNKAASVFFSAYRSFEQLFQSSTFLPLALTLIALTSRSHALVLEIDKCIEEAWPVVKSIATALGCDNKGPKSLPFRPPTRHLDRAPAVAMSYMTSPAKKSNDGKVLDANEMDVEDVGQSISRTVSLVVGHPVSTSLPMPSTSSAIPAPGDSRLASTRLSFTETHSSARMESSPAVTSVPDLSTDAGEMWRESHSNSTNLHITTPAIDSVSLPDFQQPLSRTLTPETSSMSVVQTTEPTKHIASTILKKKLSKKSVPPASTFRASDISLSGTSQSTPTQDTTVELSASKTLSLPLRDDASKAYTPPVPDRRSGKMKRRREEEGTILSDDLTPPTTLEASVPTLPAKKSKSKTKRKESGNEIDDIFGAL